MKQDCHHRQSLGEMTRRFSDKITVYAPSRPSPPLLSLLCLQSVVLYNCLSTIVIRPAPPASTTAASTTWTADRTNPLSRVQEDADHNLMYWRIGDVKGGLTGNGPFIYRVWHIGTCVNVYLHSKHVKYFTSQPVSVAKAIWLAPSLRRSNRTNWEEFGGSMDVC